MYRLSKGYDGYLITSHNEMALYIARWFFVRWIVLIVLDLVG